MGWEVMVQGAVWDGKCLVEILPDVIWISVRIHRIGPTTSIIGASRQSTHPITPLLTPLHHLSTPTPLLLYSSTAATPAL
jgi:hypothetical protein